MVKLSAPAARWIGKGAVTLPADRCHLEVVADAGLHDLVADEALDVVSELRQVLGGRCRMVALEGTVDHRLRQRRVELSAGALGDQDQRVAVRAVVSAVCLPEHAALGVGTRRDDERAAVVARPGRTALRISVSALAAELVGYQNAASSAMTAT